jgi:flagellar motor switch protein FliN/FliY
MGDGSLSQDEIDALLQGADDMLSSPGPSMGGSAPSSGSGLSPVEKDALADLFGGVMGAVAPSMAAYLQKPIRISNAIVEIKSHDAIVGEFPRQYVQVSLSYNGAVNGKNLVVLNMNDAGVISSLMMGDETGKPPAELSEAHQSTLQEFVNGLLSAGATQIGDRTGKKGIGTTSPNLSVVNGGSELDLPMGDCVKITYNLNIEGLINSKMYHIIDMSMAGELSRGGRGSGGMSMGGGGGGFQNMPMGGAPMGGVGIAPVKFPPLGEGVPQGVGQNINLLLDVQLTLTVELGRTKQYVKDILGLGEGSIIELDKLAGEPVDLLVNNKLIAKGEVVVIDENFGVRVTDIVSPSERLSKIGTGS